MTGKGNTLQHYTVNTRHVRRSLRSEVSADVLQRLLCETLPVLAELPVDEREAVALWSADLGALSGVGGDSGGGMMRNMKDAWRRALKGFWRWVVTKPWRWVVVLFCLYMGFYHYRGR